MKPIYLSPIQGYTEVFYRRIHHQLVGGVTEYFTPFLRLEHDGVRNKDLRDVNPESNAGVPVTPQLIANGAEELERLLEVVMPLGYQQIDVNMGCPFTLQTRHGRGSGILPHPEKVREIAQVIRRHSEVTFSVKMRLGLEDAGEWRSILPILNDIPLRHITLHPRVAKQQYKGEVDMESFGTFLEESRHPVIYNGDVRTVKDIQAIEKQFPTLAGIMIGRGLLARPTLAREYQEGVDWPNSQVLGTLHLIHDALIAQYAKVITDEQQLMLKVRTFWDYMEPTVGRKNWKRLMKAGNMKNYRIAVDGIHEI